MGVRRFVVPLVLTCLVVVAAARASGNENGDVYSIRIDGRARLNLTRHPAFDYAATPSPNGRRIAFVSNRAGRPDLYIMAADGSGLRTLTAGLGFPDAAIVADIDTAHVAWSPNGRVLAFNVTAFTNRPAANHEIWLVQNDSSRLRILTLDGRDPEWAPNGRQLVFESGFTPAGESTEIATIGADGNGRHVLVEASDGFFADPVWSPTGRSVAVTASVIEAGSLRAWVETVTLDGTVRRIVRGSQPRWSPDSGSLVYVTRPPQHAIVVHRLRDGRRTILGNGGWPRWSPRGTWVSWLGAREQVTVSSPERRRKHLVTHEAWRLSGPPTWLGTSRLVYGLLPP